MKQDIIKLEAYVEAIREVWNRSYYTTIGVLLRHILAADEDNEQYHLKIGKIFKALHDLRPDDHVLDTVWTEYDMIVSGHYMSQLMDEPSIRKESPEPGTSGWYEDTFG